MKRTHSINVSNQDGNNCWSYTASRIACRAVCKRLGICATEESESNISEECNKMFQVDADLGYYNYDYEKALASCGDSDSNPYKRLMLYLFFIYFGMTQECRMEEDEGADTKEALAELLGLINDTENSYEGTELVKITHDGKKKKNRFIQASEQVERIPRKIRNVVFPLLRTFRETSPIFVQKSFFISRATEKNIEDMKNALNNDYYIAITIYLGDGTFSQRFEDYKKGKKRPAAIEIHSIGGGHAVSIIDYDISHDGEEVFIIKNSWGSEWGKNGMIRLKKSELIALHSKVTWIEPEDIGPFTGNLPYRNSEEGGDEDEEDEIITEETERLEMQAIFKHAFDTIATQNVLKSTIDRVATGFFTSYIDRNVLKKLFNKVDRFKYIDDNDILQMIREATQNKNARLNDYIYESQFMFAMNTASQPKTGDVPVVGTVWWSVFDHFYKLYKKPTVPKKDISVIQESQGEILFETETEEGKRVLLNNWYEFIIGGDTVIDINLLGALYREMIGDELTLEELNNMVSAATTESTINKTRFVEIMLLEPEPNFKWHKMKNVIIKNMSLLTLKMKITDFKQKAESHSAVSKRVGGVCTRKNKRRNRNKKSRRYRR